MIELDVNHVQKNFGGLQALNDVTFQVRGPELVGLIGPNGAGKSTTIGIICSLVSKTGGSVSVFDVDIDKDFAAAKKYIGIVPQEFNFNQFEPVEEIIANQAGFYGIPRDEARQRTEKYLHRLGLWEKRRGMARELSGGMKRRLMIARALAQQPAVMLLRRLLRLPRHIDTRRIQHAVHQLVTDAARQAVDIRLNVVAVESHNDHRLAPESGMLTQLRSDPGRELPVHPLMQGGRLGIRGSHGMLAAAGNQQRQRGANQGLEHGALLSITFGMPPLPSEPRPRKS